MNGIERIRTTITRHPLLSVGLLLAVAALALPLAGLLLAVGIACLLWPRVERALPVQVRVDTTVEAMRRETLRVVQTVAVPAADAILLQREIEREEFQARSWAARAEKAFIRGDEAEARLCIERRQRHARAAEQLRAELEKQKAAVDSMRPRVESMRESLRAAERNGSLLAVRARRADAAKEVVLTASGLDTRGGQEAFRRMAEDVARRESEAEALRDLMGEPTAADQQARAWEAEERAEAVDAELEAMRSRVNGRRALKA